MRHGSREFEIVARAIRKLRLTGLVSDTIAESGAVRFAPDDLAGSSDALVAAGFDVLTEPGFLLVRPGVRPEARS